MRDPNRIPKVLEALAAYWQAQPDLRLGQIVSNLTANSTGTRDQVFNVEDDALLRQLEHDLKNVEAAASLRAAAARIRANKEAVAELRRKVTEQGEHAARLGRGDV